MRKFSDFVTVIKTTDFHPNSDMIKHFQEQLAALKSERDAYRFHSAQAARNIYVNR